MGSKDVIRDRISSHRKGLQSIDVEIMSKQINSNLISSQEFKKATNIMFYISIDNEVDLALTISQAFMDGKKVILPKVNRSNDTLELYRITNIKEDLELGYAGIPEPKSFLPEFNKHDLDLILVPGIAFDMIGNRIGYGKGHFDKLLENISVPKIAPAYDFQIVQLIPAEEHDIKMNYIITDKRVIKC